MKIGIVAPSAVPFVLGGAERLWNGLVHAINDLTPHDADLLKLPSREHSLPDLVETYASFARLDLSHFDLIISSKYPAWAVSHPNHVVYLQHRLRGLYDMYDATGLPHYEDRPEPEIHEFQLALRAMPDQAHMFEIVASFADLVVQFGRDHPAFAFPGPLAREVVHAFDRVTLQPGEIRRYAAISKTVAARPAYFPAGAPIRVVYHPSDLSGLRDDASEFFFTASRLDRAKRIDLIIEGMRRVTTDIKLVIAGTGPDDERLRLLAQGDPRIEFAGYLTTAQLVEHYSRARAVPFVPFDEDLGLITLEAGLAHKPVVTCADSGGCTELVDDGISGYVVSPDGDSVGKAMSRLAAHPGLAARMGEAAHARAAQVTWERVVEVLLGETIRSRRGRVRRPRKDKLVIPSTFPVHPRHHGGQLRAFNLYGQLTSRFDVHVVSLVSSGQPQQQVVLGDGFVETVAAKTVNHDHREYELYKEVGCIPVADISAARFIDQSPGYLAALRGALEDASAVILAEPFLWPALHSLRPDLPWAYDAYNVEADLKRMVLPDSPAADANVAVVRDIEGAACRGAALVSACSEADQIRLVELYDLDPSRVVVVPNGANLMSVALTPIDRRRELARQWLSSYAGLAAGVPTTYLALFVGSGHPPNVEAVKRLAEVALVTPDVLFVVLGSVCQPLEDWRFPANMVPLGAASNEVKDALLAATHVALNPVEQGSGTNLKLVEYLAAGAPVVATPVGARGIGAVAGRELIVSSLDSPEAFGGVVRSAAQGGPAIEKMVEAGRLLAERFDWALLGQAYGERLVSALEGRLAWAAPPGRLAPSVPPRLWAAG